MPPQGDKITEYGRILFSGSDRRKRAKERPSLLPRRKAAQKTDSRAGILPLRVQRPPHTADRTLRRSCFLLKGTVIHVKYAVISDIHANLPALDAVLRDAARAGAERCIFAGDYALSMPYPNEVAETLRSLPGAVFIRGNEEDHLASLPTGEGAARTDGQFRALYWCDGVLRAGHRAFLTDLPARLDFAAEGVGIHIAHSSAAFFGNAERREFSPMKVAERYTGRPFEHGMLQEDIRAFLSRDAAFRRAAGPLTPGVYIFGHTHLQWHAAFGGRVFLNPGSCGEPLDLEPGSAPYALLEIAGGRVRVEQRRVPYNLGALIAALGRSPLAAYAPEWSAVVARQLATAREHQLYFLAYAEEYARRTGDVRRPFAPDTWAAAYRGWAEKEARA